MPKVNVNGRDNDLSIYSLVDRHSTLISQELHEDSDVTFNSLTLTSDLTVGGNFTVNGLTSIISTNVIQIQDNIVEINTGEEGAGVTLGLAGIQINRGSLTDYQFVFEESSDLFKIGTEGDLQTVATREDSPLANGIMIFNNTLERLDSVDDIPIDITFSSGTAGSSSTTCAVNVSGGVGITGSIYLDSTLYLKGSAYGNYLSSDGSNNITLNAVGNITLNGQKVTIPTNDNLTFGNDNFYINTNSTNLNISSTGKVNITSTSLDLQTNSELVFGTSANNIVFDGTNLVVTADEELVINPITTITDNTDSTSSTAAAFVTSGGISISTTTDASSSSVGGGLTVAGGGAFGGKLYVAGNTFLESNLTVTSNASILEKLTVGSSIQGNPSGSGLFVVVPSLTYTDNATSTSGTVSSVKFNSINIPTLAATNTGITASTASTLYIDGAPAAGTNVTISEAFSLNVNSGTSKFNGDLRVTSTSESTSLSSGSTVLLGGLGVAKNIYGKNLNIANKITTGSTNFSGSISDGVILESSSVNFTDNVSSGTVSFVGFSGFKQPTLSASNTVTTTDSATLYIGGQPLAGANQTISNAYSLLVSQGNSKLGGRLLVTDTTVSTSVSTGCAVFSGGVGVAGEINTGNLNVDGLTILNQVIIDTTDALFEVSGTNDVDIAVDGDVIIDSQAGTLVLNGDSGATLDSAGSISIDAGGNSNFNATGTLTLGGTSDVTIESGGELSIQTTDTVDGIKIGNVNSGVPITIGHATSETTIRDNLTVVGNLTVNGDTATINSTIITVEDNAIVVNSKPSGLSDGGFLVRRYQTPNNISSGQVVLDTAYETGAFSSNATAPATLFLDASSSAVNDTYNGWWIKVTSGSGANQVRRIKTYNGTTKQAVIYATGDADEPDDGLDLTTLPLTADTFSLFPGTHVGMFFDDTDNEWIIGNVPLSNEGSILPVYGYRDLRCNSLNTESGIVSNGTFTIDHTDSQALLVRKNGDAGDVMYIDTSTPGMTLSNPLNTVNSGIPLYFNGYNSINSETNYSQIKSIIKGNVAGSLSGSLEFNLIKNSSLLNYLTLNSNTTTAEFSSNVSTVLVSGTAASTSSSAAAFVVTGGMSITNTTDATSSTVGGGLTIGGGAAIAKKLYIGTDLHVTGNVASGTWNGTTIGVPYGGTGQVSLTSNAVLLGNGTSGIQSPSGITYASSTLSLPKIAASDTTDASSTTVASATFAGGVGIDKKLYVGTNIFTGGNVGIGTSTNVNSALTFAANSIIAVDTLDGADNGALMICGGGTTSSSRGAFISLSGNEQNSPGNITIHAGSVEANGTISMNTNDIGRLVISYGGTITLPTTTASTSSGTGCLLLSGGIGIDNTTNSTSATNGGSFTTAGGIAVAKDARIGGDLYVTGNIIGSSAVATPTLTTSNLTGIDTVDTAMVNNIKTNSERTLSGIFRVTPNVSSSTVSFEFIVPDKSGNFSTGYGIVPSIQGYHGDFINIENISCYSVSSTLRAKVQFTSASTSEHVLQFIIRYTI